ncbi:MAG: sigma-54-dependent Fis family transcriptional regulator [Thiomargarita sp.]|nr:sigma-54-dependent Fis family transcriptional regulator [Thiomargarita sp.]
MTAHILVIDDEPDIRNIIKEILEDESFTVSIAENGNQARQLRRECHPDLILLDIWMPDIDGISLLKEWHEGGLRATPIIMISGHGTVETAVEATRLGAYDFIEKPLSISKLLSTINQALAMFALKRETDLYKNTYITEVVGHSLAISNLREQIKRINTHHTPVIISGELGSGRSLFAHYLHQNSPKNNAPFISVRLTGMSAEKQLAKLFEVKKNEESSYFDQAKGGVLFIKDIADMNITVQEQLLSYLENQKHNSPDVNNSVRIIASIKNNIEQILATGFLKKELYYHLNVIALHIPALREHCEDVPELLEFYVNFFVNQKNLPYRRFTVAAQNKFRNYHWLGNVQELKNIVQRLLILGNENTIELEEVEFVLKPRQSEKINNISTVYDLPLREARERFEKDYLEHQLQELGGNVSKVATRIGLERTHLYRKLRSLNIDPKQIK